MTKNKLFKTIRMHKIDCKLEKNTSGVRIKNIDLLLAVTHKFPQDLDEFYMFFLRNFPPQVIP